MSQRQLEILRSACDSRQANIASSQGVYTAGATKDLEAVRGIIDLAERVGRRDRHERVIGDVGGGGGGGGGGEKTAVSLPLVDPTPEYEHVCQLRSTLSNSIWTRADDQCLRTAVLNECRRVLAYHYKSRFHRDPISAIEAMSDEELARCAVRPRGDDDDDDARLDRTIDWEGIASEVSNTATATAKSPPECRVRWLMTQRPGLNHSPWTDDEVEKLKALMEEQRSSSSPSDIDWHAIADTIGNDRLPVDCLITYQRRLCPDEYDGSHLAHPAAGQEASHDEAIMYLASLWGFNWPLIGEKMNRTTSSVSDRFVNALDDRLNIGAWSQPELDALQRGVASAVSVNDPTTSLAQNSKGVKIEWSRVSQQYVGSRTWRQCRDRWNKVIRDEEKAKQQQQQQKQ